MPPCPLMPAPGVGPHAPRQRLASAGCRRQAAGSHRSARTGRVAGDGQPARLELLGGRLLGVCQKELLLPFSCKRRGFCPSCASRLYDPDRGASGRVRRAPGNDAPMGRVGPDALAVLDGVFTGPDRDRLALGLALVGMLGQLIMRETMAIAPSVRFEACFFHSVPIGRGSVTVVTTLWMRGPPPCPFAWGVRLAGSTP
jgi:hypothetical protein